MAKKADSIRTRKVAILAADGVDESELTAIKKALTAAGANIKIIAPHGGFLASDRGTRIKVDHSLATTSSVLFDAVYIPGGSQSISTLKNEDDALYFINEAFKHYKSLAASSEGCDLLTCSCGIEALAGPGNLTEGIILERDKSLEKTARDFIDAISMHRHWNRKTKPTGSV